MTAPLDMRNGMRSMDTGGELCALKMRPPPRFDEEHDNQFLPEVT